MCFLFSSCSNTKKDNFERETIAPNNKENGYPIDGAYPIENLMSAYPLFDDVDEYPQGPVFYINKPILEGVSIVTGTGPAGIPLRLINLTKIDQILGETIIDENGNFSFELDESLESGQTIGIKLGDISNTTLSEQDFLYNEYYYERPYVGILFDLTIVESKD